MKTKLMRLLALLFCIASIGCEATKLPPLPLVEDKKVVEDSVVSAKTPPSQKKALKRSTPKTPLQVVPNPAVVETLEINRGGLFPPNGESPISQRSLVVAEAVPALPQAEPPLYEEEDPRFAAESSPEEADDRMVLNVVSLRPRGAPPSHFWQELYASVSLSAQAKLLSIQAAAIAVKEREEKIRFEDSPKPTLVLEKGEDGEVMVKVSGAEGYISAKFTRVGAPNDPYLIGSDRLHRGVGSTPVDGLQSESVFKPLEAGDTLFIPVFRPGHRDPLSVNVFLSRDGKSFERTIFLEEEVGKVLEESAPVLANVPETNTQNNPLAGEAPRGEEELVTESFETDEDEEELTDREVELNVLEDTVLPEERNEISDLANGTDSSLAGEAPRGDSTDQKPGSGTSPPEGKTEKLRKWGFWILGISLVLLLLLFCLFDGNSKGALGRVFEE